MSREAADAVDAMDRGVDERYRWLEVDGIGEVRANALAAALLGRERRGTAPPGSDSSSR